MTYSVKEMFYTLQGEGARSGRPAVFCRFAGCNLWTGREQDRASADCRFCDTDFVGTDGPGGGKFQSAQALAEERARYWMQLYPGRFYLELHRAGRDGDGRHQRQSGQPGKNSCNHKFILPPF